MFDCFVLVYCVLANRLMSLQCWVFFFYNKRMAAMFKTQYTIFHLSCSTLCIFGPLCLLLFTHTHTPFALCADRGRLISMRVYTYLFWMEYRHRQFRQIYLFLFCLHNNSSINLAPISIYSHMVQTVRRQPFVNNNKIRTFQNFILFFFLGVFLLVCLYNLNIQIEIIDS